MGHDENEHGSGLLTPEVADEENLNESQVKR